MKRREFVALGNCIIGAGLLAGTAAYASESAKETFHKIDDLKIDNWDDVIKLYPKHLDNVINLEYGNYGQMPLLVQQNYEAYSRKVNSEGAYFTRRDFMPYYQQLRKVIADTINASPDEIVITRNATESLQAVITGYNHLKPGDAVLYCDHDYDFTQIAMEYLKTLRGVNVIKISLPYPATKQNIIDAYEAEFKKNPKIKMVIYTHLSHRDGLIIPIRELNELAHKYSIAPIVDSAKSIGLVNIDVKADGFDYAVFNLHKYVGSPLGVGALYIKKDKIENIDTILGSPEFTKDPILSRIHSGTINYAAQMAAIDALNLHNKIGVNRFNTRMKAMRAIWTEPLKNSKKIEILTPDDPHMNVGITSFRLKESNSVEAHAAFVEKLLAEYHIFTVIRTGLAGGAAIRVTPGATTTEDDMKALLKALS